MHVKARFKRKSRGLTVYSHRARVIVDQPGGHLTHTHLDHCQPGAVYQTIPDTPETSILGVRGVKVKPGDTVIQGEATLRILGGEHTTQQYNSILVETPDTRILLQMEARRTTPHEADILVVESPTPEWSSIQVGKAIEELASLKPEAIVASLGYSWVACEICKLIGGCNPATQHARQLYTGAHGETQLIIGYPGELPRIINRRVLVIPGSLTVAGKVTFRAPRKLGHPAVNDIVYMLTECKAKTLVILCSSRRLGEEVAKRVLRSIRRPVRTHILTVNSGCEV